MTTITLSRAVVEQALEALENAEDHLAKPYSTDAARAADTLRTALAQQAEPTSKESLQVPPEVAATLTTSDIAWLETRRLTKLWRELGQMRWAGADEGWDRAIDAVRSRLNDECQAVLDWKAKADQSQATAVQLLRKMQGVKDD